MNTTETSNNSLADELEALINKPEIKPEQVSEQATLAFLQNNRILQAEQANVTVREALNKHGASISDCAGVLAFIIQDVHEKADVRRRAVADALSLHNAAPAAKVEAAPAAIQIVIQTSDHVNLANVLNPARMTMNLGE